MFSSIIIKTHCHKYKSTLFVAIIAPVLCYAGAVQNLPEFADSSASVMSPEYERRLGQLFLKQVRYFSRIISDPEVESYIESIGYQLASHSDNTEQPFKFFVVDNPGINAFAGPGGMIGINSGIILNADNESELASVMSHEIAHVTQRHLARMLEQHEKYSLPSAAAMMGAILIAIANPDAGAAAMTGITGLNMQNQINFTRANEKEADRIGMQLLVRAGHNPRSMPAFFEKLQRLSRFQQGGLPEYMRTHPFTTSRIADTRARAEEYPPQEFINSHAYMLVRHKLLALSYKTPRYAVDAFLDKLNNDALGKQERLAIQYGLAYACLNSNEYALARRQIDILLKDDPDDVAYLLLAALNEKNRSNYQAALAIYEKAYELYPDYKPVIIAYSRALLDVKRAKKARQLLTDYERYYSHTLETYSLLGQAEGMLGNEIEVAMIQVDYYYLAGETSLALDKLKFIKRQYPLDYYLEERIKARMQELQYELELEESIKL